MLEDIKAKNQQNATSLRTTLIMVFIAFSILSLLLISGFQIGLNFQIQQRAIAESIVSRTENEVAAFIEKIFNTLEAAAQVGNISNITSEDRHLLLTNLLGLNPNFKTISLLDERGRELFRATHSTLISPSDLINYADTELFAQVRQNKRYISPIYVEEATSDPLIKIAIPFKSIYDDLEGALVAEVTLIPLGNLLDSLQVGESGTAYVVDKRGQLVAFADMSRVIRGEKLDHLEKVAEYLTNPEPEDSVGPSFTTGLLEENVLTTYVPLAMPDWAVFIELPVTEIYQEIIWNLLASVGVTIFMALLAGLAGVYISRHLATPLLNLTETAAQISAGKLELEATPEGPAEVARLANAFNSMTTQLKELIGSLEQRVAARTQRLEIVANLSERLSAILKVEELLLELVHQVKDSFGYYHAHVYLLDDQRQNLVLAAGVGEAGAKMKADGHHISISANSLVARAARSGEIVSIDDVHQAPDWLPNPLLPNTRSEMAVPIILEEQPVGVLDVQQDQVAGLDEGDANLLRSLANQVAVAIRNARLFAQAESALAEARAVQERYLEQTWNKARIVERSGQYLYVQPNVVPPDQGQLTRFRQQEDVQDHPILFGGNGDNSSNQVLVAPVTLRDKMIGALQLPASRNGQAWTEDDLLVIQAVVDQLAQTAETLHLFEETHNRANRERVIREIVDKMQAATSLEKLIKIAAEELGERLSAGHVVVDLGEA